MWSVCSFHNTEVSKMSETEEFVSGTVSCAICGVPITERNIGYHRERLCNHVKDVPEVKLELFQILKLVYKEYAWLKRPRSPDDKRLRAKVLHIENHFQFFLASMFDYLYRKGDGWFKHSVQRGCKAGGSCYRIKLWYEKPKDLRYAGDFSNREITDIDADLMLEIKSWGSAIFLIDAIIKKQVGLDFSEILFEMVDLYADLVK